MTNYGALAILALPRVQNRMEPGEAELRLMIALETITPGECGERRAATRFLAQAAGLDRKTVMRARDRLVKAGVIEFEPGTGTAWSTWRLMLPSGPIMAGTATGSSGPNMEGTATASGPVNMGPLEPGPEAASGPIEPPSGPNMGGTKLLSEGQTLTTGVAVAGPPDRASARGDDDEPKDFRRGPGRVVTGRVLRPGERPPAERASDRPPPVSALCRRCGRTGHGEASCDTHGGGDAIPKRSAVRGPSGAGPPVFTAPKRRPPDEVAAEGRARVNAALLAAAAGRAASNGQAPDPEPLAVTSEDQRRALALRQVRESRVGRDAPIGAPSGPVLSDDEGPLWAEEGDPDDPPF